jgi:hypothetical protein
MYTVSELGVTPPLHIETAAFSVIDGKLKTLLVGENNRALEPWNLGVPTGTIEMDPETGAMLQPHEVALRGVRSVIEGSPDVSVTVHEVGVTTITAERIACVAFMALVPPINTASGHEHVPVTAAWMNPELWLREGSPAKASHYYTLVEAYQGLWRAAMNGWRDNDLSPLTDLLAPEFTLSELHGTAIAVLDPPLGKAGVDFDIRNFTRKTRGLLSDTGKRRQSAGRPAPLYAYQSPTNSQWRAVSHRDEANQEKGRQSGVQSSEAT